MADALTVWLYGVRVATIDRERGRPRLVYTGDALGRYPLGTPLLSLSLPIATRRYTQGVVRPFLDGLLPEGNARIAIARDVGVSPEDTFGLIRELGRDCAGAVVIQPDEDPPPSHPTTVTAQPLGPDEIAHLVKDLRSAPLGVGGRVRISLAGIQEKLVLTRMPDGSWGRPIDGTPSTHILKPEIATYPQTVENEAFCMRIARHLDLDVAEIETTEIGGRKLIVVKRYDRIVSADGSVERVHQEDFCQATNLPPETKYEGEGGPSLRRIAGILESVAAPDSLEKLLRAVTLNVLIGNGDAHAKNLSLLHEPTGGLALAPLYDLLCTLQYGDDRLAMYIDDVRRTTRVTTERIENEAVQWGLSRTRAAAIVSDLLAKARDAITAAHDETQGVPAELVTTIENQLRRLRATE